MVWFGVPREMLVLFDFGPRETCFPPKLAYASRGGTTALEAYQRLSRAEIPRETLKTMTWLYKDLLNKEKFNFNLHSVMSTSVNVKYKSIMIIHEICFFLSKYFFFHS